MKRVIQGAEGLTAKERAKIAETSKDPKELSRLSYDNAFKVKEEVLTNSSTPSNVKKRLAIELKNDPKVKGSYLELVCDLLLCNNIDEACEVIEKYKEDNNSNEWLYNYWEYALKYLDDDEILEGIYSAYSDELSISKYTPYEVQMEIARKGYSGNNEYESDNFRICNDKVSLAKVTQYPEIMKILMKDKFNTVRRHVSRRSDEFDFIYPELINDEDTVVVGNVISNVKDKETLLNIINSDDYRNRDILDGIAEACEKNGYTDLANDLAKVDRFLNSWKCARFVGKNASPDTLVYVAHKYPDHYNLDEILTANSPDEVVEIAANSISKNVRAEAAKYVKDPQILAKLAKDRASAVREAALSNPNYDPNVLYNKGSKSRTPQADWSIPIYQIKNYSEIEDEIDRVVEDAAKQYASKYYGSDFVKLSVPEGAWDSGEEVTLEFNSPEGHVTYSVSADEILGPATSQNKKSNCIKTLVKWFENNLD